MHIRYLSKLRKPTPSSFQHHINLQKHHLHQNRHYSLALTRAIPESFQNALSSTSNQTINVETAKNQHDTYASHLRTKLYTVTLPPVEAHPDCPFLEDTVVTFQKKALVNRIGAPSRQGEVLDVLPMMQNLGMEVVDMRMESEDATCDGGDVMIPSSSFGQSAKHLFVGKSDRTNDEGVQLLEDTFGDVLKVISVPSLGESLHLKSSITHIDEHTLIAPQTHLGDEMIKAMNATSLGYTIIQVPDPMVCNLVSVNGLILTAETECEETKLILEQEIVQKRDMELQYLNMKEFAKCDGSFTCLSVLLNLD